MFNQVICVIILLCIAPFAYGQITVDFSTGDNSDCGSLALSLADMSTSTAGDITAWEWTVAGITSSLENPSLIINDPGSYEVCLTVWDDTGNTASLCQEDFVIVLALPEPNFDATPVVGCAPLQVTYSDLSQSQNGEIVEWLWGTNGEFDGGTTAAHSDTYENAGVFDVSLTIWDDNGCFNTVQYTDFITVNAPPEISFNADVTDACETPLIVNFSNTSPATGITYFWDFGNGQVFEGYTPSTNQVVYTEPGSYTVRVIAEDANAGCSDTLTMENYINVGSEVLINAVQTSVCDGGYITFQDHSTVDADSVLWNFGDGQTTNATGNYSHIFAGPGCYTVSLTRYVGGCPTVAYFPYCIEVHTLPEVSYTLDNLTGCDLPFTVNFESSAPTAVSYEWDFDSDGIVDDSIPNPSHTYTEFGDYTVSLTIYDGNGCVNTNNSAVVSLVELEAALETGAEYGCAPLSIVLSESNNSIAPIVGWEWTVSGENFIEVFTEENPAVTIPDTGLYDVQLTVVNLLGCEDTQIFESVIGVGMVPEVEFSGTPLESCVNNPVEFSNLSSAYANEWFWDFGDGEFSPLENPEHQYQDTGFFEVSLTVVHNGCSNNLNIPNYVDVIDPLARFTISYDCGNPLQVSFEDSSIGAETVFWDFGVEGEQGDTSIELTPVYAYSDTGTYIVRLTAFNSVTSCLHTMSDTLIITQPQASFSFDTNEGCVPLTVQLSESSQDAYTYQWFSDIPDDIASFSDTIIPNPTLTINTAGMYTGVGLVITDVNDCTDTLLLEEPIYVNEVTADFSINPLNGCAPLEVNFTDQSQNLFAENNNWHWTFGIPEEESFEQNTSFTYADADFYSVSLTVGDTWGCEKTISIDSLIDVTFPVAAFTTDSLSCTDTDVNFQNISQGRNLNYLWDLGDGNTSTMEVPDHQYDFEGTYTICLTVTDIYGCSDQTCLEDYLVVANPVADFIVNATYWDCPPFVAEFQSTSINATSFQYDFGDGSGLSNQENPTNVYLNPGVYDVSLIVSSTSACSDTLTIENYIQLDGPLGDFHFEIDSSCVPMSVTFFAGSNDFYAYIWDFGDGTSLDTTLNVMTDTITHVYNFDGTFVPTIIFIDETGCKRTVQSPESIVAPALYPDFITQDSSTVLCDVDSVTFVNISETSHDLIYIEWQFESGNPAVSNEAEPVVNYAAPGSFDVTLIVDNGFCRDTIYKENYIGVGPLPIVDFDLSETAGCSPLNVTTTNNSSVSIGSIGSYEWNYGGGNISNDENITHEFNAGESNEIQLIVTTDVGCQDSLSQYIDVFPAVEISAGTAPVICIGEFIQLQAEIFTDTSGINFYWESDPTLSCTNCFDPVANPVDTTTYTFVAISSNDCISKSEVTINVKPYEIPEIQINPFPEVDICANDAIQLLAQGGDDIYAYQWDTNDPGLTCYDNCFNPVAQPEDTTTYHLTVTSIHGCTNIDSVTVNVINMFQPIAGSDRSICEDGNVQLNVAIGNDPVWSPATNMSCVYCPSPTASPDSTVTYVVSVTTDIGCEIFDSITIEVLTEMDIDAGPDQVICTGEEATLVGTGQGDIAWLPGTGLSDSTTLVTSVVPLESGYYHLSATKDLCILNDSVFVEILEKTAITGEDFTICEGDSVSLKVEGVYDTFHWGPSASLSDINVSDPFAFPEATTQYEFIAQLSSCEPDTAVITISVNPLPQVKILPTRNFIVGQEVQMEVDVPDNTDFDFEWSPTTGLSCTDCPEPTVNIDSTTNYKLTIQDLETGCWNHVFSRVNLLNECPDDLVKMPNIFSPNDDGNNDEIGIEHSPAILEIQSLEIFNRWGGIVFTSRNIDEKWNGKDKGKPVDAGVYVYMVKYICPLSNEVVIVQGDITILR